MTFEHWTDVDLMRPLYVKNFGTAFSQDSQADKVCVRVKRNGEDVALTGSIRAWIIRADNVTIQADGGKSGNTAWVILPAEAYVVTGKIGIYLKEIRGAEATTLCGVSGLVYKSM